ncbi:nucleotide-binding protein [Caballeronia sp. BR00000012568055]|uniref:nucleotide-binding protein n=1 Tax=Caballeronia sp. BR00000012568055 TaxID=2918761 RepID=UPI0023F66A58|nr:nucleotide-binding protein [Caballeronia sp. BR00000012568055]
MSVVDARAALTDRIQAGDTLLSHSIGSSGDLDRHKAEFNQWDDYNNTLLRKMFTTDEEKEKYDYFYIGPMFITMGSGRDIPGEIREHLREFKKRIERLTSVRERLPLFDLDDSLALDQSSRPVSESPTTFSDEIFIVHGHDNAIKEAVARLLQTLGLRPVILSEQANQGRTIIEKFEDSADVGFAIVLMTGDDIGGKDNNNLHKRARQNVILELGYFVGRLQRSRVCALHEDGVEIPSDILGVGYVKIDPAGHWRYEVAKELRAAGYKIDLNKL